MTSRAAHYLAQPFKLGSATLSNRIVMAPMTRERSPDGVPGDDVARYYARRAAGGTGLILTEATFVDHPSAGDMDRVPRFYGEEALAAWGHVAESVHAAGGVIMPQLWHKGIESRAGYPPYPDAPSVGPSGIGVDGTPDAGETLSLSEIDKIIEAFADAAQAAERLGFDGVELHGAHGYLIDQFFWTRTNQRTDKYGGSPAARARFGAEIITAIRERVAADFPVVFRFSQWKVNHYTHRVTEEPDELGALLQPLVDAGVTAFHASGRRYWTAEFPETGLDLNLAGWTKKLTGRPVITVGSVGLDTMMSDDTFAADTARAGVASIENLLERLDRGEFDLVAIGRAILADPDWANKVLTGREDKLIPYDYPALETLD